MTAVHLGSQKLNSLCEVWLHPYEKSTSNRTPGGTSGRHVSLNPGSALARTNQCFSQWTCLLLRRISARHDSFRWCPDLIRHRLQFMRENSLWWQTLAVTLDMHLHLSFLFFSVSNGLNETVTQTFDKSTTVCITLISHLSLKEKNLKLCHTIKRDKVFFLFFFLFLRKMPLMAVESAQPYRYWKIQLSLICFVQHLHSESWLGEVAALFMHMYRLWKLVLLSLLMICKWHWCLPGASPGNLSILQASTEYFVPLTLKHIMCSTQSHLTQDSSFELRIPVMYIHMSPGPSLKTTTMRSPIIW